MKRWLWVLMLVGCAESEQRVHTLLVRGPDVDLRQLAWSPPEAVIAARRTPFGVELETRGEALELSAPDACPQNVDSSESSEVELAPLFEIRGGGAQLGFGASVKLEVVPGCDEARRGKLSWSGDLAGFEQRRDGWELAGKLPPLRAEKPHGIIPLSARTRGALRLELRWEHAGRTVTRIPRVAAAARATGLPSVAPGQRIFLGGDGWRVRERPRGGVAEVSPNSGVLALVPDRTGRWLLEDAHGSQLSFLVGTHAAASLDCGRSDCHAEQARHAQHSPMTTVFARGLAGELRDWDPSCVAGCHTVGEPGLDDGGFAAVLAELDQRAIERFDELPRALRRLAGVGCTACHGPGAIPEPSARFAILRSDVCAVCHDAPGYPEVEQWRATRMARADRDAQTRNDPACQRCHTTAGFIGRAPAPAEHALGIGCAACHAPHAANTGAKLVRHVALEVDLPASAQASRVCVPCHSGPEASAATLLFASRHPHAAIAGGCLGCHGKRDESGRVDHSFGVDRARCKACHETPAVERISGGASIRKRAEALYAKLGGVLGSRPPHARRDTGRGRALELVRIVLEDPAAADHNASHARALLDEAERLAAGK